MNWIVTNGERYVRGRLRLGGYLSFDTTKDISKAFRFTSEKNARSHALVMPTAWHIEEAS